MRKFVITEFDVNGKKYKVNHEDTFSDIADLDKVRGDKIRGGEGTSIMHNEVGYEAERKLKAMNKKDIREYHVWAKVNNEWRLYSEYRKQWNETTTLDDIKEWLREFEDDSTVEKLSNFIIHEGGKIND